MLKTDNYNGKEFCNSNHVFLRYFNSLGQGFYAPKEPYTDGKGILRKFDSQKTSFSPFGLLKAQLIQDLDLILAANESNPANIVSLIQTVTLNHSKSRVDGIFMEKLVKDFLINSPALRSQLADKDDEAFSDGKAIQLARVLRCLQIQAKDD